MKTIGFMRLSGVSKFSSDIHQFLRRIEFYYLDGALHMQDNKATMSAVGRNTIKIVINKKNWSVDVYVMFKSNPDYIKGMVSLQSLLPNYGDIDRINKVVYLDPEKILDVHRRETNEEPLWSDECKAGGVQHCLPPWFN